MTAVTCIPGVGDLDLAELANRLRSALRVRGTVWSDAAARLGGDFVKNSRRQDVPACDAQA